MSEPLVVIGNGMAAARFADELSTRALGRYAVAVIGEEPRLAYNRVLLSSVLAGEVALLRHRAEAASAGGATAASRCATAAARPRSTRMRAASRSPTAQSLPFSKLVFATGSQPIRPAIPGMALPGVITFRDISDIWTIWHRAGAGDRVVVIGGGLLGLEAAYGLAKAGARVTVLHLMDRLMERQLDAQAAAHAAARRRGDGHRGHSQCRDRRDRGQRPRRGRDAEGRPHASRPTRSWSRSASGRAPIWRATPASRSSAASWSTTRSKPTSPASTRSANAPSIAASATGWSSPRYEQARVLARSAGGRDARYAGSVLATNLKVSGVNVFSAGDFLGARRHRGDRALRSGHRHSTRSSSSRTAASPARCCSAIPRTGSGIST